MNMPKVIHDLELSLNELLSEDDSPDISIKKLAAWMRISESMLRTMNMAHELPFGMAYKEGERGYHYLSKLAIWNYFNNGGVRLDKLR